MDLRFLLNPMPDPEDPPRINNNPPSSHSGETVPHPITSGYIQSRFFLSPRRLDPETSSVSTNSSTKRRRTNRGRVDDPSAIGVLTAEKLGRTFSELQVPSDSSTDEETMKHGVSQLSLTGMFPFDMTD
jgi:hypothetical protein